MATDRPALGELARYRARLLLRRIDNPQVGDARRLLRRLRHNSPDVIQLGESTVSFVADYDRDRRALHEMVANRLAPALTLHAVHGGSYHAELLCEYVRLIETTPARPVVVLPLWIRGRSTPWIEHPVHGHQHALSALRRITPQTPAWRAWSPSRRLRRSDFEAHRRLPHPSLLGDLTVGDYLALLKDPARRHDVDRLRTLYAYHHGGALRAGSPEVAVFTALGASLRRLGCRVVVYQTPVSVDTGEAVLGPAFGRLLRANFDVLDDAFQTGYGPTDILQTGATLPAAFFIDPADGTEHLNERGRVELAAALAHRVRQELAPQLHRSR